MTDPRAPLVLVNDEGSKIELKHEGDCAHGGGLWSIKAPDAWLTEEELLAFAHAIAERWGRDFSARKIAGVLSDMRQRAQDVEGDGG